ncbi:hypothetical protein ABE528_26940, partial [Pseudomonas sp. TWI628]
DVKAGIFRQAGKVKPIIQTGLLSLAVLDPKVAHQVIPVSVWVEGTAYELHERLAKEVKLNVNQLNDAAKMALVDINVAAGTLELDARNALNGMKISAGQASKLVRDSFTGLRGTGKGWELLLSLGGLFLMSDSLDKNLKSAEKSIGYISHEALIALYGNAIGLMGGGIEAIGLFMPHRATTINKFSLGRAVASTGAIISAASGFIDALQSLLAASRTFKAGDDTSGWSYLTAAVISSTGSYFAIKAVALPFIIGPLGVAISLSLIAYAISKKSTNNESTPLERWTKRCHFGFANETPKIHWDSPNFADIALSELNSATLGISGQLIFKTHMSEYAAKSKIGGLVRVETTQHINFHLQLPHFNESTSSFHLLVAVHRNGDGYAPNIKGGELIVNESYFPPSITARASALASLRTSNKPKIPDYINENTRIIRHRDKTNDTKETTYFVQSISGTIELTPDIGKHNILTASLNLTYWPDRNIPDAYAEIALQEEN